MISRPLAQNFLRQSPMFPDEDEAEDLYIMKYRKNKRAIVRGGGSIQDSADKLPQTPKGKRLQIEPVTGSNYQFYLRGQSSEVTTALGNRHFDVVFNTTCSWDKDETELNMSRLSTNNQVNFHRMYYTWKLQRRRPSPMIAFKETSWQCFKDNKTVAIEDLMEWVTTMQPYSVHDYKPLLVLMQAAFRVLLDKELDFFSETLLALKHALQRADEQNKKLSEEIRKLKKELNISTLTEASGRLGRQLSQFHKDKKDRESFDFALSEAEQKAELERKRSLKEQREALDAMMKKQQDDLYNMEEENTSLKKTISILTDKKTRLSDRLKTALTETRVHMEQLKALKEQQEQEEKERASMLAHEGLNALFNKDYGAWLTVKDLSSFKIIANAAINMLEQKYDARCIVTRVTYNAGLDLDGEDDPDGYNDNLLEILLCNAGHKEGFQFFPAIRPNQFEAANTRNLVQIKNKPRAQQEEDIANGGVGKDGSDDDDDADMDEEDDEPKVVEPERIYCAPIISVASTVETPLAEVWGVLEARADEVNDKTGEDGQKLKVAVKFVCEGLSHMAKRLHEIDLEEAQKLNSQSSKMYWNQLQGKHLGKKEKGFWTLSNDLKDRQRKISEFRELQKSRNLLEAQIKQINKMLLKESSKCAIAQIKQYRKPTWNVVSVMVAVQTLLGDESLWKLCKFDNKTGCYVLDKSDDSIGAAWTKLSKNFNCGALLKQLKDFDPEVNDPDAPTAKWEEKADGTKVNRTQQMNDTVDSILKAVSGDAASRASHAVGMIHQWTMNVCLMAKCLRKIKKAELDLGFDPSENTELEYAL